MSGELSPSAVAAMNRAHEEAIAFGHDYVGTEHLLIGLLGAEDDVPDPIARLRSRLDSLRDDVITLCGRGTAAPSCDRPVSARCQRVLALARADAAANAQHFVGTTDLLRGIALEGGGVAVRLLIDHGVRPSDVL